MAGTLERLDGAAERILRGLAPLTVERARADEVAATHRARYATAVEMGWAPAESMPDGMERDADDDRAVVLVCRDGTGIAGSARLVVPVPGRPLPTERDFGLEAIHGATDLGRLVIGPEHRGMRSPLVIMGLFARAWLETRALGLHRIVASAPSELVELYRTLGVRLTELGPPWHHWGAERVPVELSGVGTAPPSPTRPRGRSPAAACS